MNKQRGVDNQAIERVSRRIQAEPSCGTALCRLLGFCMQPRSLFEIEKLKESCQEVRVSPFSIHTMLGWLVASDGIEELDAHNDEGDVLLFRTTLAGAEAVCESRTMAALEKLVFADAARTNMYLRLLNTCLEPHSRSQLDTLLGGDSLLDQTGVFLSHFINNLERVGGLEWDGRWRTTEQGRILLERASLT